MTPRIYYGGTFDPVHEGHLAIARRVSDSLSAPVHLLPSADPPHRPPPGASASQRAHMLDLAVAEQPQLRVDRRELRRRGPSFTVETLDELRAELGPDVPLVWVLGLDSLLELDTWHEWRRIFTLAHVLAVQRPDTEISLAWLQQVAPKVAVEVAPRWGGTEQLIDRPAGTCCALAMQPLRGESATQVRHAIGAGLPWSHLVPRAVATYIEETGLYRPLQGT